MSALPSAEEIKLKIKVAKKWNEEKLKEVYNEYCKDYTAYKDSDALIWFLVAKDLKIPVAISRGSASRPDVDLPPKESYIRLIDFDPEEHFTFNIRGYVVDKWLVNGEKMRGKFRLADESGVESVAIFLQHEEWFSDIKLGESYHFQGMRFMPENTDSEGRTWPPQICTGFRTVISKCEADQYDLPAFENISLDLNEITNLLPDSPALVRGVVVGAEMINRYIGCPKCWKGTGVAEGAKVKCEKCESFIRGVQFQGLAITLQDTSEEAITARFAPWFEFEGEPSSFIGKDLLVLGSWNDRFKSFEGIRIISIETIPTSPEEERELTIDDLDFSRDEEAQLLSKGALDEYIDVIKDTLPKIINSIGGQTAEELSQLIEIKWTERVTIKPIVEQLLKEGLMEIKEDKETKEPKLYWVE